jgi:glycerol-3-phosphate acyltransferase PlsY
MLAVSLVALGYLSGSVPFGVLLTRWFVGADVRRAGSGNIGATNVARVGGKGLGIAVLLLDTAKGALPTLVSIQLSPSAAVHAAVGLGAFLGHVFPVWLKFRGGKGVATALGVLSVLEPWAALSGFLAYAVLFAILRVSSIGSLAGGVCALIIAFLSPRPKEYAVLTLVLFALMVFTHRGNIRRLLKRAEQPL